MSEKAENKTPETFVRKDGHCGFCGAWVLGKDWTAHKCMGRRAWEQK